MKTTLCKHCHQPILKFHFRDQGDQWWHADPSRGAPAYRRCNADPTKPFAEPA